MEPESEEGNVEYKLRLGPTSKERIQRLASQMKYRLAEGGGEAFYVIGVTDSGEPLGISEDEVRETLATLSRVASIVGATLQVVRERKGRKGKIVEVLVRISREDSPPVSVTIAVLGNVDAGKSTVVGVLCTGELDDGRGSAMKRIARYLHEIESGRTSSISTQYLGFDGRGSVVNYDLVHPLDESEVYLKSSKVVALVDLGGHERYLKTTLRGVMARLPDYSMLVVGANSGLARMGREHLGVCVALGIPVFVVVTKIDRTPREVLGATLEELYRVLKMPGVSKLPLLIRDFDDVVVAAHHVASGRIAPVFLVSNVTGEGLELLREFLNLVPPRMDWREKADLPFLMYVEEVYNVRGVGPVAGGIVREGSVSAGDEIMLGPFKDGSWREVEVRSIHVSRLSVRRASAGQDAALALSGIEYEELEKGMALLDPQREPKSIWEIRARITILRHPTTIKRGYQAVLHCGAVRSTVSFVEMEREPMRTGDVGEVTLRFEYHPWYLREGDRFILREARTRAIGRVLEAR